MDFQLVKLDAGQAACTQADALLALAPARFKAAAGDALSELIASAIKGEHFKTEAGATLSMYLPPRIAAPRVLLAGIGDGSAAQVRKAIDALGAELRRLPSKNLLVCVAGEQEPENWVGPATRALAQACYSYQATKSKPQPVKLGKIVLGTAHEAAAKPVFARAKAAAAGVRLAREWANRPANHATPAMLAEAARALAGKKGPLTCQVLGPKEVAKLGMGAFQAVAQGSAQELRLIVLRYEGAPKSQAPVALIGKGITFDAGGISLKPGPEMDEMKFDMSGAASVLGVFHTLGQLRPKINVVGLIAACENLPDGRAVKPGDVVTSMSGQTIEILNTDAEGRLILCDALTYARRFKPRAMVDIATLTGACMIALGGVRSGLFSADDALARALEQAGDAADDPCWRMPLDEDYAQGLKSNFADIANVAGRPAGSVTAAKFLQKFVGDTPWAHLDIAGTAWLGGAAKGATGRPVALLLEYLLGQAGAPASQRKRRA
ncbi:MAG: leucyl aminopeptidase [Burkholderiaceae bacterium]|nr:leucyl aminopeptidase [Burkholderiaceae bacterium]